ncbi:hypothetical protein HA402_003434 [Bradysia odoriphaga]|nr:hypothetical protein HA402_003434 [Bradysia odoriphaga]
MEAFKTIPQYMRLLNYAAFKSFIWNHLVTYRIRTFGLKPVPGDIVSLRRRYERAATEDGNIEQITAASGGDLLSDELRVLTENDFDPNGNCRDYSIHDVVLDSPGSRMTTYTNPKVQSYFEMLLKINQLDVHCFARFMERYIKYTSLYYIMHKWDRFANRITQINRRREIVMDVEGEKLDYFRAVQDDNTIPMVSSDGEPHEILTLIAVGTGLVAAVIVLIFLIVLIDCRKRSSKVALHTQNQEVFSIFGNNEMLEARMCEYPRERFMISSTIPTTLNEKLDVGETIFSKALPEISTVSC